MQTSMMFTIGTALSRAHELGYAADLLVDGHWLSGRVVGADAIGVVLEDGADQCVVRLERIAVVRVRENADAPAPTDDAVPVPGQGRRVRVA